MTAKPDEAIRNYSMRNVVFWDRAQRWVLPSHMLNAGFFHGWYSTLKVKVKVKRSPKRQFTYALHSAIAQKMSSYNYLCDIFKSYKATGSSRRVAPTKPTSDLLLIEITITVTILFHWCSHICVYVCHNQWQRSSNCTTSHMK